MADPKAWVEPPPFTPLPYGLLSVADPAPVTARDPHWRNGVKFQPDACGEVNIADARCLDIGLQLENTDGLPIRGSNPFAVYAWIPCGPLSFTDRAEAEARVTAALTNNEGDAVEATFWTGAGQSGGDPIYPHLAADSAVIDGTPGTTEVVNMQTAATVITGSPVDVVEGLGALEGALASCYSGVGVVHITRDMIAHMSHRGLIHVEGNQLKTLGGNLVAAGSGYPGTAPDGTSTSGVAWAYITGAIRYWRSGIELNEHDWREAIDKAVNDLVMVASRVYVLGWDCCHYAIPISLGGVRTGTFDSAT